MRRQILIFLIILLILFTGCAINDNTPEQSSGLKTFDPDKTNEPERNTSPERYMNTSGVTLKERFQTPDGFERLAAQTGSFAEYLQNLPLKTHGSKVKLYNGGEKSDSAYLAVVDFDLGDRDLQQCADSLIRLRAEYFYDQNRLQEIHFNFTNGFNADFNKWSQGYGIRVEGNDAYWVSNSQNDASKGSFKEYLDIVYAYAGTLSLEAELKKKDTEDMQIGDVFIRGGSPGHCIIIADMAKNQAAGETIFMLAQSYMPAQDIQILKNPDSSSEYYNTQWYPLDFGDTLITPEWTTGRNTLKSWE